jgi:hypothetical protein
MLFSTVHHSTLPALLLLCSCYRYEPLQPASLEPGAAIRMRISGTVAEQVAPLLGSSDARVLVGRVISVGADTMIVEVPTTVRAEVGSTAQTLNQRVSIPLSSILELETRTLSRGRTAAVVGAAGVVTVAVLVKGFNLSPGKEQPPTGGGPADLRVP